MMNTLFPSGRWLRMLYAAFFITPVVYFRASTAEYHPPRQRRAPWIGVVLLCCFALAGSAQNTAMEELQRADKQFNLYAYNLALRTYENALKMSPANPYILARIADCHFQLNRPQESLKWYAQAVNQNTAESDASLRYGKALMHTGDYVGAKKQFLYYAEGNKVVGRHFADMCDYAINASGKSALYQIREEQINTAASDYSPVFWGDKVVYCSARGDMARKGAKATQDWAGTNKNQLFYVGRNGPNGVLAEPRFLRSDLQNDYNEGPVSYSADGRRVAFCRNNFIDGARQIADRGLNMSLYTADVSNGAWINIRPFPFNGSDFATGFPCLSADGNTLWFSSNDPVGSGGGWDIYVSEWRAGVWEQPRNLGLPVNTPGNEVTPFVEGKNLYFASDWHKGFGGLDVFRADLNGDETGANIYHLGPGINSSRDDYGFIFNSTENMGYVTSNRSEGRGNEDIWQVRKRMDEFTVVVIDGQTNPVPDAEIDFSACGAGSKRSDSDGRYSFAVTTGKADCRITVRKAGYTPTSTTIRSNGERTVTAILLRDYGGSASASNERFGETASTESYSPAQYGNKTNSASKAQPAGGTEVLAGKKTSAPANTTTSQAGPVLNGYAIQLAASPEKFSESKLNKYGDLTNYGNLYQKWEGKTHKLRLGIFTSKEDANQIFKQIKSKYKDCFVADEKNADAALAVEIDRNQRPAQYSDVTAKSGAVVVRQVNPATPPAPALHFSVQVGSHGAGHSVALNTYAPVMSIGNLYTKAENGLTKVRLGVWSNYDDAATALSQAIEAGYNDASIVTDKAGEETTNLLLSGVATDASMEASSAPAPTVYSTPSKSVPSGKTKTAAQKPMEPNAPANAKSEAAPAPVQYSTPTRPGSKSKSPAAEEEASDVAEKPAPYATSVDKLEKEPGRYFVRICSVTSDPKMFNVRQAEKAGGKLETRASGNGATVMLLGGFTDLSGAIDAHQRLLELGYKDAYVVKETEDLVLRRVKI